MVLYNSRTLSILRQVKMRVVCGSHICQQNRLSSILVVVVDDAAKYIAAFEHSCAGYLPHPCLGSPIELPWMKPFDVRIRQVASTAGRVNIGGQQINLGGEQY